MWKGKDMEEMRDALFEAGKRTQLFSGPQVTPVSPSDKGSMTVKAPEWLEMKAAKFDFIN
jgi:hypothetical protein